MSKISGKIKKSIMKLEFAHEFVSLAYFKPKLYHQEIHKVGKIICVQR